MQISTDIDIRQARTDEAAFLSALALRSKAYWGYSPEFLAACQAELSYSTCDLEDHSFFVAERQSAIVGFYALVRLTATEFELEALFLEPAYIGRGYGRTLVEHAQATAANLGGSALVVQGDPHAARFYLAAGGIPTGKKASASIPGRYLPTFTILLLAP